MKTIDLYKFVEEHNIEYHWHNEDVILMPSFDEASKLNKMIPLFLFNDSGIECIMKYGYLCIYMKHICEYCDIELIDVFPNKNN